MERRASLGTDSHRNVPAAADNVGLAEVRLISLAPCEISLSLCRMLWQSPHQALEKDRRGNLSTFCSSLCSFQLCIGVVSPLSCRTAFPRRPLRIGIFLGLLLACGSSERPPRNVQAT